MIVFCIHEKEKACAEEESGIRSLRQDSHRSLPTAARGSGARRPVDRQTDQPHPCGALRFRSRSSVTILNPQALQSLYLLTTPRIGRRVAITRINPLQREQTIPIWVCWGSAPSTQPPSGLGTICGAGSCRSMYLINSSCVANPSSTACPSDSMRYR